MVFGSNYPIITSLNASISSNSATYYITQGVIDIGPSGDIVVPAGWKLALSHKHHLGNSFIVMAEIAGGGGMISNGTVTRSQLGMDDYSRQKNVTQLLHSGSNDFKECVGYIIFNPNAPDWDQAINPGGCMIVPPASQWCKITTPEVVLEHGTITLQQANGDTASTSMGVQCTGPTAVTFNLVSQDKYVYLDEGKSEISVDNQPLNTKIDLPQGDSQVPVKDLLTGITKEGFHTGSSVLVMAPY